MGASPEANGARASLIRSTRWPSSAPSCATASNGSPRPSPTTAQWKIRLLANHRDDIVAERTRAQNRLRWHLVDLCPQLEAELPARSLNRLVQLDRVARARRRLPSGARVRVARELVSRIRLLTRQANDLETELRTLVKQHRPDLLLAGASGQAGILRPGSAASLTAVLRTERGAVLDDAAAQLHADLFAALGRPACVLLEPVVAPGVSGVLVIDVGHAVERRREMLALLATEAASAIARADVMAELEDLARVAPLTGLPNRRAWDESLNRALGRSARDGRPLSVVVLASMRSSISTTATAIRQATGC